MKSHKAPFFEFTPWDTKRADIKAISITDVHSANLFQKIIVLTIISKPKSKSIDNTDVMWFMFSG